MKNKIKRILDRMGKDIREQKISTEGTIDFSKLERNKIFRKAISELKGA